MRQGSALLGGERMLRETGWPKAVRSAASIASGKRPTAVSQARPPRKAHHPPPGGQDQSSHPERAARSPPVHAATTEPATPLDRIGA